jgi:tRNA(Ile)-lysidine synthase
MTMPLLRTLTSVFAVPRSMPISSEKRPRNQFSGLTTRYFLPLGIVCATGCAIPNRAEYPTPQWGENRHKQLLYHLRGHAPKPESEDEQIGGYPRTVLSSRGMEDLLARVHRYASRHGLLPPGETVVVGVSGGPDSLALLHLLVRLSPELRLDLRVAHLNHGLRGAESDEDAGFVADLANRWGLPCTVGQADLRSARAGRSLEEAARVERYRFLGEVAVEAGGSQGPRQPAGRRSAPSERPVARTIAVGHNADDQAETVLMHLLRGAGVAGLRGMLPRTALSDYRLGKTGKAGDAGQLWLIRPLLGIPRRDVEVYCAEHDLEPRFDRSNEDLTLTRNRLRHELLPLLEQYNPAIRRLLAHTGEVMAGDAETLRAALASAWQGVGLPAGPDEVLFDLAGWRALSLGLQRATFREAIHRLRHGLRDIGWEHVERAVWLAREGETGQLVTLPRGLVLEIGYRSLRIASEQAPWRAEVPAVWEEIPLCAPGMTLLGEGWRVIVRLEEGLPELPSPLATFDKESSLTASNRWEARLDAEVVGASPVLRPRLPGESFLPQGLRGHSVRLGEFMINEKIPRSVRATWPLLAGNLGLAWVCGLRVDERAAIRANSRHVWHIRFERVVDDDAPETKVTG